MSRFNHIYGRHPVAEALRARPRDVQRVYLNAAERGSRLSDIERLASRQGIEAISVPKRKLDSLVGPVPHQGVVAAVVPFAYAQVEDMLAAAREKGDEPLIVALDHIQDPHNLGAIVRSAYALGAHGLIFPKDRAVDVTPTVVKASAGATSYLAISTVTNLRRALEELKEEGLWVIGAAMEGSDVLGEVDLSGPTCLVVGSEGRGLRRIVVQSCDRLAHIPMEGALGSLNASVAASIFLYEARRQRLALQTPE